jgi:hypothetical protein
MAKSEHAVAVDELAAEAQNGGTAVLTKNSEFNPFNIPLNLPNDDLLRQAAEALNVSEKLGVGAGLCLLEVKSRCQHGEFAAVLDKSGIAPERAREVMAVADMLRRADEKDRERLLKQSKTAQIGLARMDDEVRKQWLETGELDERLTLNEYKALLDKNNKQLKAHENTIRGLTARLRDQEVTGRQKLDAITPLAVSQLRTEGASYVQDALACLQGFVGIRERLADLQGQEDKAHWVGPLALSLASLLTAVRDAAAQQLGDLAEGFDLAGLAAAPETMAMATPGPEEAQAIGFAMQGVLVDVSRRHGDVKYAQYEQDRKAAGLNGRKRKPGVEG